MKRKLKSLSKTVAASGTPERLSPIKRSSTFIKIRALNTNTNPVFIGDESSQVFPLSAGQELPLSEILTASGGTDSLDLFDIFCRVTTNGEGVAIIIVENV